MKRLVLCGAFVALLTLVHGAFAEPTSLRIGYQKASSGLVLAKEHGLLEKRFPATRVQWIEFPAGPQMLEALNVGSLDVGATGDIPPIFAQAAGADLLYIGAEPPKPRAEVILVPPGSGIAGVAGLKGRKVAFQKGSSAHNLLLRALQRVGLGMADIQPVYLSPADARAAFEQGAVDAWAIWDPFYSAMELEGRARLLANGEGLDLTGAFVLGAREYVEGNPEFIQQLLDELSRAEALTRSHRDESIAILARFTGLAPEVLARTFEHRPASPIGPVTPEIVAAQQRTADLFRDNRLLPRRVDIGSAVWRP